MTLNKLYPSLGLIITIGIISRCIHLFDNFYYILSADSYIFHHIAHTIQTDTNMVIPVYEGMHTGLAYPVGYLAKITGLFIASCIIPLIIHILMSLLLYWFTSRHWGKMAGLATVAIWALIPQANLITATGYLDRDGLSLLILTASVILIYESYLKGGYILYFAPAVYVGLIWLMWAQWVWIGVIFMLFLLLMLSIIMAFSRGVIGFSINALKIAVVVILGVIPMYLITDMFDWGNFTGIILKDRTINIAEDTTIRLLDPLVWYSWAFATLITGIYVLRRGRREEDNIIITWFFLFFGMAFISNRCSVFALPAVCILSGISIDWLVSKFKELDPGNKLNKLWQYRLCLFVAVFALVTASIWSIGGVQHTIRYAPNSDWQGAFKYLKDNTPENTKVAIYGDYGYWMIDLGERAPSSYGNPESRIEWVAKIYCSDNPGGIIGSMNNLNCDYFLCSDLEFEGLAFQNMCKAVFPNKNPSYLENNSLIRKLLYEEIDTIEGLNVVYRKNGVLLTQKATDAPNYTTSN